LHIRSGSRFTGSLGQAKGPANAAADERRGHIEMIRTIVSAARG
jgi:hypothetical protein